MSSTWARRSRSAARVPSHSPACRCRHHSARWAVEPAVFWRPLSGLRHTGQSGGILQGKALERLLGGPARPVEPLTRCSPTGPERLSATHHSSTRRGGRHCTSRFGNWRHDGVEVTDHIPGRSHNIEALSRARNMPMVIIAMAEASPPPRETRERLCPNCLSVSVMALGRVVADRTAQRSAYQCCDCSEEFVFLRPRVRPGSSA